MDHHDSGEDISDIMVVAQMLPLHVNLFDFLIHGYNSYISNCTGIVYRACMIPVLSYTEDNCKTFAIAHELVLAGVIPNNVYNDL